MQLISLNFHVSIVTIMKSIIYYSFCLFACIGLMACGISGSGDLVHEMGLKVVVDNDGNSYVTGIFSGRADFDPGLRTDWHDSDGDSDLFLIKFGADGNYRWVATWGGPWEDEGSKDILVDSEGNVYVTGYTFFLNGGFGGYLEPSAYLSKYDSQGNLEWFHEWEHAEGLGLSVNDTGNIVMACNVTGGVDWEPGLGPDENIESESGIILSEFYTNGNFVGSQLLRSGGCYDTEIDNDGNIFIRSGRQSNQYNASTFRIRKYDDNRNQIWEYAWLSKRIFSNGNGRFAVDNAGNLLLAGSTDSEYYEDPDIESSRIIGLDHPLIFLHKFNSDGMILWTHNWIWNPTGSFINGIAVDSPGNIYITGYFSGYEDFDPGPVTEEHASNGFQDVFICKLSFDGEYMWVRTWGGPNTDEGVDITVDEKGGIYVTGMFSGTVDFDPGPDSTQFTSVNVNDVFLSKFDPDGNFIWVRTWGGENTPIDD